jgi:hypothetical protein
LCKNQERGLSDCWKRYARENQSDAIRDVVLEQN